MDQAGMAEQWGVAQSGVMANCRGLSETQHKKGVIKVTLDSFGFARNRVTALLCLSVVPLILAAVQAKSCSELETLKESHRYLDTSMNLDQLVAIRLPSGHAFKIPLGYLGARNGIDSGKEYLWKGLSYYFCFPKGNYSLPDMSTYFPVALARFDTENIPISIEVEEHFQDDQAEAEIRQKVQNFKKYFKPSTRVSWDRQFGLIVVSRRTRDGDLVDYVSEDDDPDYIMYGSHSYPGKQMSPSVEATFYDRHSGLKTRLLMPDIAFKNWKAVLRQVSVHLISWAANKN